MSVTAVPLRPVGKGTIVKMWIGILAVVLLGVGLAWASTSGQQYVITDSGLRMRTLKDGTGEVIKTDDLLALNMTGMVKGGEIIHQTQAGQPDILAPDQVIPGLREALLTMQKDGVYQVIIPPNLAYGPTPPPGAPIPPQRHPRIPRAGRRRARRHGGHAADDGPGWRCRWAGRTWWSGRPRRNAWWTGWPWSSRRSSVRRPGRAQRTAAGRSRRAVSFSPPVQPEPVEDRLRTAATR